mmetsp:Transcript_38839/g.91391  ORF Transcript_38839/g.91391 Transcript_38839/m.91391 type:complete len:1568 (+) Transcript_38839:638-5341(+)
MGYGDKGGKGKPAGDTSRYDRNDKGEKGDRSGYKGGGDRDKGGGKGGKGKPPREEKVVEKGLKGKVVSFIAKKPSGFIKRLDGERDVYFDLADVIDGEEVRVNDYVEFDVVEGNNERLYAARVKKASQDAPMAEETKPAPKGSLTGALTGSLTGALTGSLTAAATSAGATKLGASTPGKLTGGLSLRPGGLLAAASGNVSLRPTTSSGTTPTSAQTGGQNEDDGLQWGRVVLVQQAYGFLQPLVGSDTADVFFRAADVVGINCNDPGEDGVGLQIQLPGGRNATSNYRTFWLKTDDEVSYVLSKDHVGKPCAVQVRKEQKGAWRNRKSDGRDSFTPVSRSLRDQLKRLMNMDADEVLQNVSLFKEVLDSADFEPFHLYKIVGLLASRDIAEDTRSDPLYRLFMQSKSMQSSLRTTVIQQSHGTKHSGTFMEDCLKLVVEIITRSASPASLRGQLPLEEIVEAWESLAKEGTKKGLPEEVLQNLQIIENNFPDDVSLDRILGNRSKRQAPRTAADDPMELMEAYYYQDMPILPTSSEMIGQCAFEIEENMRTYEKCEDYIQTHFMLLREDYIEPLRAGIRLFMEGRHSPKDLHVYTGMKVVGILSTWEGIVYRVELRKEEIRRINWEKTKQLMYGSLLCLSDDNFDTLIWATVWRRDESTIAHTHQLDIRLPFEPFDYRLSPGKLFSCIENVTIYFEAYRHVLIALQNMRPNDVPFQTTLLTPQPKPEPPKFLKAESDMFHFHNVFGPCEKPNAPIAAPKLFPILQEWPESLRTTLDLDPSQLDAIQHALTHQLALIQGPPGTGKTWVGLKIVQAILDNTKTTRHSPILVVCYTNHALDQFLEGIMRFCERIARIGSRSKSDLMKQRNLKELMSELQPSQVYKQARRGLNDRRDILREEFASTLKLVDTHSVELSDAWDVLSEKDMERLLDGYRDYLAEDAKGLPDDPNDIEPELWAKIMTAWLDTRDVTKVVAPLLPKLEKMKAEAAQVQAQAYGEGLGEWEELADAEEEEEAEDMRNDRALDVEPGAGGSKEEDGKRKMGDLVVDLSNAWLPTLDEHVEKLKPELRNLNWRQEELWTMPVALRRETYRRWLLEIHEKASENLPELARKLERNAEQRAALERDRKLGLLQEMEVVGMTTTAVSKYQQLLKELRPEIVIVEEAAEVLEAHILTALHPRTQHVVLIGDHQQLRPSTAVYRLSKNFHLDVSLFERLIHNGAAHVTLEQQRRMHPSISRLIKPLYPNLRDHSSVSEYPEIMGVGARTFFFTHTNFEDDEGESHSKANSFEANFIGALAAYLIKSGYQDSQLTVLSPYLGQVRLIRNRLRRDPLTEGVKITAVDNFQGEEADVILISLVRSNRNKTMGFLAVENRINVALTRARHGMFIVGNANMLKGHQLWSRIMDTLSSHNSIGAQLPLTDESGNVCEVKSAEDILGMIGDTDAVSKLREDNGRFSAQPVADRWAGLGKDDEKPDSKGRGRGFGKGDRGDTGRSGGYNGTADGGKGARRRNDERNSPQAEQDKTPKDFKPVERQERNSSAKDEGQDDASGQGKKAGKKQKQKGQTLFRCG